jgi:excisionase family DNA binding protein
MITQELHTTTPKALLWDIRQAAAATGLSVHTLYSWISQKKITYVKAGRKVLFDPNDIQNWIESHKVVSEDRPQAAI